MCLCGPSFETAPGKVQQNSLCLFDCSEIPDSPLYIYSCCIYVQTLNGRASVCKYLSLSHSRSQTFPPMSSFSSYQRKENLFWFYIPNPADPCTPPVALSCASCNDFTAPCLLRDTWYFLMRTRTEARTQIRHKPHVDGGTTPMTQN